MRMTREKPTAPGWYWYCLPGSWRLQPCYVFEVEGRLYYTHDSLPWEDEEDEPDAEVDGFEMSGAAEDARWSDETIPWPEGV